MAYFKDKEPTELKAKAVFAIAVIALIFSLLTFRIWYLQIVKGSYYKDLSEGNRIRLTAISAPRGLILDTKGNLLAENTPGFDLYIVPEDITHLEKTTHEITRLINIDIDLIDEKLKASKRRPRFQPVKIKENLSWEEAAKISAYTYELPGVILHVGPKRVYPYTFATAHLLGYMGEINENELRELSTSTGAPYKSDDLIGQYGIEVLLEHELKGIDGGRQIEVDVRGREIRSLKSIPSKPGNNVVLTIDLKTQLTAWDAMVGKVGAVVAIDPRNGKILAMVSSPSFDPNEFSVGVSENYWKEILRNPLDVMMNRTIQGQYPPASTFKIVTAAAALEEGVITPQTKIKSGGQFKLNRHIFRDWKASGHGKINVTEAIIESADTFFYQVGLKTGMSTIAEYAKHFGFGDITDVGLKNEKYGLVPTAEWKKARYGTSWYDGETVTAAVGQSYLLTTPLQLLNAYAAIANGGTIYKPSLVERVVGYDDETILDFEAEIKGSLPLSEENIEIIRNGLRGVISHEDGTARWINIPELKIAGKTGTAQVVRMKERSKDIEDQPYKLRDHALFVGFAPYDNPIIAVAVIVEHGGFGSTTAAPIARDVIKTYIENNQELLLKEVPDEKETEVPEKP
ncbi:MAG: penicillin-binding protein 2 [Deltaproteobacteria bacterium]|nr:penicillin-binding protein 2 [Deltaproteobacteria bacterium]